MSAISLLLVAGVALAQDGFDAHSLVMPVPSDGDPLDPLAAWRPEVQEPLSWSLGSIYEYADGLAVSYEALADGTLVREDLLGSLSALNLSGTFAPGRRFALTAALPTRLASTSGGAQTGAGLGDLRLAVPVGLRLPHFERGLGISVVPFFDLPTGDPSTLFGDATASGGALLAVGVQGRSFGAVINVGLEDRPTLELEGLPGGPDALGRAVLSYTPTPRFAAHLEGVLASSLASWSALESGLPADAAAKARCSHARVAETIDCDELNEALAEAATPAEIVLDGKYQTPGGVTVVLAGAVGVTSGAGAGTWRGELGVIWSPGGRPNDWPSDAEEEEEEEDEEQELEPTWTADIQDVPCEGGNTGSLTARRTDNQDVEITAVAWMDEEGLVRGREAELSGVAPGTYTYHYEWRSGGQTREAEEVWEVGYQLDWVALDNAVVGEDGAVRKAEATEGWDAQARSRNRLPAEEEGWVELPRNGGDGRRLGLVPVQAPAAFQVDSGYDVSGESNSASGGQAVANVSAADEDPEDGLRVTRTADGAIQYTVGETSQGASQAKASSAAALAALGEPGATVQAGRASFGCPEQIEPDPSWYRLSAQTSQLTVMDGVLRVRYDAVSDGVVTLRVSSTSGKPWEATIPVVRGANLIEISVATGAITNTSAGARARGKRMRAGTVRLEIGDTAGSFTVGAR